MNPKSYEQKRRAEEMKHQLVSFSLMIFFTLLSFIAVELNLSKYFIIPFILLLAVIQTIFQLYYFMHLKEPDHGFPQLFIYGAIAVALPIIVAFSFIIWW